MKIRTHASEAVDPEEKQMRKVLLKLLKKGIEITVTTTGYCHKLTAEEIPTLSKGAMLNRVRVSDHATLRGLFDDSTGAVKLVGRSVEFYTRPTSSFSQGIPQYETSIFESARSYSLNDVDMFLQNYKEYSKYTELFVKFRGAVRDFSTIAVR